MKSTHALIVTDGPDRGATCWLYEADAIIIGRHAPDFPFSDSRASRSHANIYHQHGQWMVEDLRSTHGTLVNNQRIATPVPLHSGDRLQLGRNELLFTEQISHMSHETQLVAPQPQSHADAISQALVPISNETHALAPQIVYLPQPVKPSGWRTLITATTLALAVFSCVCIVLIALVLKDQSRQLDVVLEEIRSQPDGNEIVSQVREELALRLRQDPQLKENLQDILIAVQAQPDQEKAMYERVLDEVRASQKELAGQGLNATHLEQLLVQLKDSADLNRDAIIDAQAKALASLPKVVPVKTNASILFGEDGSESRAKANAAVASVIPSNTAPAKKVVFMIDVSGKLLEGHNKVIELVQQEITQLDPGARYTVLLFNGTGYAESPPIGLKRFKPGSLRPLAEWIRANNRQMPPGEMIGLNTLTTLAMAYQPDRLAFYSDGAMSRRMTRQQVASMHTLLERLNADRAVRIDGYQFFNNDPNNFLQNVSQEHGGRFEHYSDIHVVQPDGSLQLSTQLINLLVGRLSQ